MEGRVGMKAIVWELGKAVAKRKYKKAPLSSKRKKIRSRQVC